MFEINMKESFKDFEDWRGEFCELLNDKTNAHGILERAAGNLSNAAITLARAHFLLEGIVPAYEKLESAMIQLYNDVEQKRIKPREDRR